MVLQKTEECKDAKKMLMPFVAMKCTEAVEAGVQALELTVPFDELALLQQSVRYLTKALELTISVEPAENGDAKVRRHAGPHARLRSLGRLFHARGLWWW